MHTCTHAHTHARTHTQHTHTHTHTHTLIHCLFLTGDISDKGRLFRVSTSHFAVDLLPHLTSHDAVICLCSSDENANQLQEIMEKLVTSVHQDVSQLSLHHSCFENEQLSWLSEWSGYGVACVCLLWLMLFLPRQPAECCQLPRGVVFLLSADKAAVELLNPSTSTAS